eukprot:511711_1
METEIKQLRSQLQSLQNDYATLEQENKSLKQGIKPSTQRLSAEFWSDVKTKLRNDTDGVKSLIKNKAITIYDVDHDGHSLLTNAAYFGNYEITQLCINLGADLQHQTKKGRTALDQSRRGVVSHHVEQLLLLREMEAHIGERIKNISCSINKQKGIIENILNGLLLIGQQSKEIFLKSINEVIINIINKKQVFSDDMLNLCWKIAEMNGDPLQSELWHAIKSTCQQIISKKNKRDWYWMKHCLMISNIWYYRVQSIANIKMEQKHDNDDSNEQKSIDKTYLYYFLLDLVNKESKNQLDKLDQNITKQTLNNEVLWNNLINFKLEPYQLIELQTDQHPRQDNIPNGIVAGYTKEQLNQNGTNHSFEGVSFYDHQQYLCNLLLLAQTVDAEFQKSIQKTFNVNKRTNIGRINVNEQKHNDDIDGNNIIEYKGGPVKLLERARAKAINEYTEEDFPTSSCVLDFNRCSLVFKDIKSLLNGLDLFIKKVTSYQSGCVIGIVRLKNGFTEYAKIGPRYADIKVNVLIKGKYHNIVGEVQFLITTMVNFKKSAHNLYSISREEEFVSKSVTKILPSLLDITKQLKVSASLGNINGILQTMVDTNKSLNDIKIVDKQTNESILISICQSGNLRAFQFIGSLMDKQEFTNYLFNDTGSTSTPIEWAVGSGHQLLLKNIFQHKTVKQKYQDMSWIYRAIYVAFVHCNNPDAIDLVMKELGLTNNEKVLSIINNQYSEKSVVHKFHQGKIVIHCVMENNLTILKKLNKLIGLHAFSKHALMIDSHNMNAMEAAIARHKLQTVKYLFNIKQVKVAYVSENMDAKLRIYRLLYWIFGRCDNQDITKYVLNQIGAAKGIIENVLQQDYPKVTQRFEEGCPEYHNHNIIGEIISESSNALRTLKKFAFLIADKVFEESVLQSDGYNVNGLERAIMRNDLDVMMYLMGFIGIKKECINNIEIKWRIVFWLCNKGQKDMIKYILSVLNLNDKSVDELMAYKCLKPDNMTRFDTNCCKYWNEILLQEQVRKLFI